MRSSICIKIIHASEPITAGGNLVGQDEPPLPLENWPVEADQWHFHRSVGLSEAFSYDLRTLIEAETPWHKAPISQHHRSNRR